jgi:hypothetical protein
VAAARAIDAGSLFEPPPPPHDSTADATGGLPATKNQPRRTPTRGRPSREATGGQRPHRGSVGVRPRPSRRGLTVAGGVDDDDEAAHLLSCSTPVRDEEPTEPARAGDACAARSCRSNHVATNTTRTCYKQTLTLHSSGSRHHLPRRTCSCNCIQPLRSPRRHLRNSLGSIGRRLRGRSPPIDFFPKG